MKPSVASPVRFACLVSAALLSPAWAAAARTGPPLEKSHLPVGDRQKAWLPNLGRMQGGEIVCAYIQGTAPRLDSVWVIRTANGGKSWSEPVKVMGLPGRGYLADPNILAGGKQATVFATFVPDTTPPFARSETWASTSTDGGKSWGKPFAIPLPHRYVSGKVHVPLTLADGTVLMGYSWDTKAEGGRPANSEGGMVTRAGVLRSGDGGKTWKPGGDVAVNEPMGADEPALVLLRDGALFAVFRTGGPRPYEGRSRDGGLTWEDVRPSRFDGYNSPSALYRLQDGAILRVWDHSPKNRYPLVAALSTDECRSWSKPRTITEPGRDARGSLSYRTACYPSIVQADDGIILVVWWETGDFGSRLGFARLPRGWLDDK